MIGLLRKIFGSERDEVTGQWRRLRNERLYDLYCSPNTNRMISSRGMDCSTIGNRRGAYRVVGGGPEGKRQLGRPWLDRRIKLKWIFKMWDLGVLNG